jgi:hypothetical protein
MRRPAHIKNRRHSAAIPLAVILGITALVITSSPSWAGFSGGRGGSVYWGIPDGYVHVDGGHFGSNRWTLWMKGKRRQRCVELGAANERGILVGGECGPGGPPPDGPWAQELGGGTSGRHAVSLVFQVTVPRVRSLTLLLGPRPLTRTHIQTKLLGRRQARHAHLARDFRYAVAHRQGTLCIKEVTAFDRNRRPIAHIHSPCEL